MQTNSWKHKLGVAPYFKLNPVTSLNTSRYDNPCCVQLSPWVINRGPASRGKSAQAPQSLSLCSSPTASAEPTSSAAGWQRVVHPEGQPYFVLISELGFAVVTEANIEDTQTKTHILACVDIANNGLQSLNIDIPPRCELFLELGDDPMTCNYYFVDHTGKALFWLEDLGTEALGIPAAMSFSHLEWALERLYWVHVEFFPMHHESHEQEFSQTVTDLYNIISHGQADRLTSRTSTFPYTADTCRQFLKLLSRKRGQRVDGYTLSYAARLASATMNQRFLTFYGQQSAQLDRLQEMFPSDVVEHKWLSKLANLLMWGIPRHYNCLLDELYVNQQVYADHWTHFMSECLTDWANSLSWSLPIIIASILLTNVRGGTVPMAVPSVLSCTVSIASASCLHLRHRPLAESSAAVGARYLAFAKWSNVGFLPSSVVFGLPRATYLWGLGFLAAQLLFIASRTINKFVALLAACVIAAVLAFMLCVIYPEDVSVTSPFGFLTSLGIPHSRALDPHQDEERMV